MERVDFTFKRGGVSKSVTVAQAKYLQMARLGTYKTRDMARQPMLTKPMQAEPLPVVAHEPQSEPAVPQGAVMDELEDMDKEQLHALAKERGVKVHHMAGADKVRAVLRGEAS